MSDTRVTRRTMLKSGVAATTAAGFAGMTPLQAHSSAEGATNQKHSGAEPEPNMEIAKGWWTEGPNRYTPINWKDHPSYFGVHHNATVQLIPKMLLGFNDPSDRQEGGITMRDDKSVLQGWSDCDAPVLWSRWFPFRYSTKPYDGVQLQQEVFIHVPGAVDVTTGKEPAFAWVRMTVAEVCDGFRLDDQFKLRVKIGSSHLEPGPAYPDGLTPDRDNYDPDAGYRLMGPDGTVRLAIAPGQDCTVEFKPGDPEKDLCSLLNILLNMESGAHVDLLMPGDFTGTPYIETAAVNQEMELGYDNSLEETNIYWSKKPETAALFDVPEEEVNEIFRNHLKTAEMVAKYLDGEPFDGYYYMVSGSVFATSVLKHHPVGPIPTASLTFGYLLNLHGYHSVAEKYLQGFKACQGKFLPVGDHFEPHPGYLGEPRTPHTFSWFSQHGALLWAIADHALLWGKPEIIEEWTPVVVKACDWIQYALSMDPPENGYGGIMPPGLGSDIGVVTQDIWNDAFMYKGLLSALRFLRRIDHPRTQEFTDMAKTYRENYQKAIRDKSSKMETWTHTDGKKRHMVPTSLMGDDGIDGIQAPFGLDIGPMALVWGGLLDADDELMENMRLWYREGPPKRFSLFDQQAFAITCLFHETSSCEPHWSWVMWHSWQLGDRQHYLEAMYSIWMAQLSHQTYSVAETRNSTGRTPYCPSNGLARFAVIDDEIREDELHLLRMMPLAWLRTDRAARFEKMPTFFGPIDLRVQLAGAGKELDVSFNPNFRYPPQKVVLHIPPVDGLRAVRLNGKKLKWDRKQEYITIA